MESHLPVHADTSGHTPETGVEHRHTEHADQKNSQGSLSLKSNETSRHHNHQFSPVRRHRRLSDWILLILAVGALLLAPWLIASEDLALQNPQPHLQDRLLVWIPAGLSTIVPDVVNTTDGQFYWPFPHACMSRRLFDIDCPGCGLTRSTIKTLQGQWLAGFKRHHWGWLAAFVLILQIPYRILSLSGSSLVRQPWQEPWLARCISWGIPLLALVITGEWILQKTISAFHT
ncbi:DUF2752 domain-containing protein [Planctopirus limnophila]|uniref:DUF2752 domain-containing protein n=1 Tax=Planctopirus limnophila TaxID=120 RepID=UPI0002F6284B|nr:DUF2752 domain-containing protein [Planctopirus limnophila]